MEKKDKIKLAVLEERIKNSEKSLELQAKEYERRLENLNNEAERLARATAEMKVTYLSKESYEANHLLLDSKTEQAKITLSEKILQVQSTLDDKISQLQKLVYIGVGIALLLEALAKYWH